jgi:hypothetical protein
MTVYIYMFRPHGAVVRCSNTMLRNTVLVIIISSSVNVDIKQASNLSVHISNLIAPNRKCESEIGVRLFHLFAFLAVRLRVTALDTRKRVRMRVMYENSVLDYRRVRKMLRNLTPSCLNGSRI